MSTITYEPDCGDHIHEVCKIAVKLARKERKTVLFNFNGTTMLAQPTDKPSVLVDRWRVINEAEAKAYRNSPEGIAKATRRKQEVAEKQRRVDKLLTELPAALGSGLTATIAWLRLFIDSCDDVDVQCNKIPILRQVESAGFMVNAHVGKPKEAFDNLQTLGEYIVGQVLEMLSRSVGPHPIAAIWCDEYLQKAAAK